MSILTAESLGLSFGSFDLFQGISVTVANDSKIGLIGPNGIGKTSLLLILAGINPPTAGKVHLARGRRMGYLRQEAIETFADSSHTVYAEMLTVFADVQDQQARLSELEARMTGGEISDPLLEEYGRLQEAFSQAGGYDYEVRIQQTLQGLGLGKDAWHMPLNHLSGGQKTRALLARLLLEKPDLLMLDEPTNHLDIEAVEWLEHILNEWDGAVLIVSHDRFFLDNTVNTIWEMNRSGIEVYSGNYSRYLLQRQERWEYTQRVFEEEKTRLVNDVDFIQRNWVRASTYTRALGLLRRLTRELAIVDNHGIMALRSGKKWSEYDADTIRGTDRPLDVIDAIRKVNAISLPGRPLRIRPRIDPGATSGTIILRANHVTIGYPGNALFTTQEVELRRGECAGLIGPNGSGKTTFLKTLLGQIESLQGEVQLGASLKIGYFAQAHDDLKAGHSVMDELLRHREMLPGEARSYLAPYLFREDDVFKPVSALSGGERARLALAILALDGSNFLVLDEPTNHLDIPAQESLQEVLEDYPGTILLVSHDRYLIDRLGSQIWELSEAKLSIFRGTYREFVLRKASAIPKIGMRPSKNEGRRAIPLRSARTTLPPTKPLLRMDSKDAKRRAEAIARVEGRIHEKENDVQRLYRELQKASEKQEFNRAHRLSEQLAQVQAALDSLMADWEKLAV